MVSKVLRSSWILPANYGQTSRPANRDTYTNYHQDVNAVSADAIVRGSILSTIDFLWRCLAEIASDTGHLMGADDAQCTGLSQSY
jgi:hypothetical protein